MPQKIMQIALIPSHTAAPTNKAPAPGALLIAGYWQSIEILVAQAPPYRASKYYKCITL